MLKQEKSIYLDERVARDDFSGVVLVAKDGIPLFQGSTGWHIKVSNPQSDPHEIQHWLGDKIFTAL